MGRHDLLSCTSAAGLPAWCSVLVLARAVCLHATHSLCVKPLLVNPTGVHLVKYHMCACMGLCSWPSPLQHRVCQFEAPRPPRRRSCLCLAFQRAAACFRSCIARPLQTPHIRCIHPVHGPASALHRVGGRPNFFRDWSTARAAEAGARRTMWSVSRPLFRMLASSRGLSRQITSGAPLLAPARPSRRGPEVAAALKRRAKKTELPGEDVTPKDQASWRQQAQHAPSRPLERMLSL